MSSNPQSLITPDVKTVTNAMVSQLMSVMGLKRPNEVTRCLYPLFRPPAQRVARLLVNLDRDITQMGWNPAVRQFLIHFASEVRVVGAESIPAEGPLLVVGNHPAALDIVILFASIQREDLKFLHSDIPLVQLLPHIAAHGIPVPYYIPDRLQTVRSTLQHLKNNGCIFIFPRGNVEPDPTVSPGAVKSLSGWSSSIEMFLRRMPETKTVVAISSGMLSGKWFKNPFIKRWKKYEQRQKVAEIFQIASQIVTGRAPDIHPQVRFSRAFSVQELGGNGSADGMLLSAITTHAQQMLTELPLQ